MSSFQKIILILFSIITILVAWNIIDMYQGKIMADNTKRLIELGIARERVFWKCLSEKNMEKMEDWKKSESYKIAIQKYDDCAKKADTLANSVRCKTPSSGQIDWECRFAEFTCRRPEDGPDAWPQTYNDQSSPGCSVIADESEDGRLMSEYRKKVPAKVLTDTELRYKIMSIVRPY